MAVDHARIRHLLGEKEESTSHGLGAKSLRRVLFSGVPETLTPYEWEGYRKDNKRSTRLSMPQVVAALLTANRVRCA